MSVDSGLCTVARLLTGIEERANHSFALGMYALNSISLVKAGVAFKDISSYVETIAGRDSCWKQKLIQLAMTHVGRAR